VPAVLVGAVNPDNNQHAPNENLRVTDFWHSHDGGDLAQPLGDSRQATRNDGRPRAMVSGPVTALLGGQSGSGAGTGRPARRYAATR
jgi:hypothetical protein